jgi:hypothetical protein
VREQDGASTLGFAAPAPASLAWCARRDTYTGLKSAREWMTAHSSFSVTALACAVLVMLHALFSGLPRWRPRRRGLEAPVSAWRLRPLEMATRSELVGEGHALSPLPGDDGGDTLGLLEALRVCGPVAHGDVRRPLPVT